jgi:predicted RNA-binding Zn-ribbon protein involved in translation (DUF1610 family)
MSDKLTPPPCPDCGADADGMPDDGVRVTRDGMMGMEEFTVECNCGFEGPTEDSRVAAVVAWSEI